MPDTTPVAPLARRDRLVVWLCIGLITALAWTWLARLAGQMSGSMAYGQAMADMGMTAVEPWQPRDVVLTMAMWTVMMAGMMAPSALPVLLLFASAVKARAGAARVVPIASFALGYAVIWTTFSAVAALVQWWLHEAALLSPMMISSDRRVSGAILLGAGLYQLTPLKGACLTQCRSPLGVLMGHWRDGASGALRMGLRHGAACLGCCWAVMCVLFVVGVMNLLWVAAISAFVLVEKLGPRGALVARAAGIILAVSGLFLLVRTPLPSRQGVDGSQSPSPQRHLVRVVAGR
ncbi:MAG TPA: DUF2182 domain-containing protein [Vicinamibacterales bacterium]|nr:DUF2182 domain-containing protein [Vicinamibacterales bacterium]